MNFKRRPWFSLGCLTVLFTYTTAILGTSILPVREAYAQSPLETPLPGGGSPVIAAPYLKAITVDPRDPFKINFLVDAGVQGKADTSKIRKLVQYFLTFLTIPEEDLWVNLSPAQPDRVVNPYLGETAAGRDMLAEDYLLKQAAASMTHPDRALGKLFWERVFEKIKSQYGDVTVPVDTFNRVWVVPAKAVIYTQKDKAFIAESHLKVLLDEDYQTLKKQLGDQPVVREKPDMTNKLYLAVARDIVIPELEREVNEGAHFAPLRQMYYSLLLAIWFKRQLKENLVNRVYTGQYKIAGMETHDRDMVQRIYGQYMAALKKGAYDFIREAYDPGQQQLVPRRYFSGGVVFEAPADLAMRPMTDLFAGIGRSFAGLGHFFRMGISLMPRNGSAKTLTAALLASTLMANTFVMASEARGEDLFGGVFHEIFGKQPLPRALRKYGAPAAPDQSDPFRFMQTRRYRAIPSGYHQLGVLPDVLHAGAVIPPEYKKYIGYLKNVSRDDIEKYAGRFKISGEEKKQILETIDHLVMSETFNPLLQKLMAVAQKMKLGLADDGLLGPRSRDRIDTEIIRLEGPRPGAGPLMANPLDQEIKDYVKPSPAIDFPSSGFRLATPRMDSESLVIEGRIRTAAIIGNMTMPQSAEITYFNPGKMNYAKGELIYQSLPPGLRDEEDSLKRKLSFAEHELGLRRIQLEADLTTRDKVQEAGREVSRIKAALAGLEQQKLAGSFYAPSALRITKQFIPSPGIELEKGERVLEWENLEKVRINIPLAATPTNLTHLLFQIRNNTTGAYENVREISSVEVGYDQGGESVLGFEVIPSAAVRPGDPVDVHVRVFPSQEADQTLARMDVTNWVHSLSFVKTQRSTVAAPASGKFTFSVRKGQYVTAGEPVGYFVNQKDIDALVAAVRDYNDATTELNRLKALGIAYMTRSEMVRLEGVRLEAFHAIQNLSRTSRSYIAAPAGGIVDGLAGDASLNGEVAVRQGQALVTVRTGDFEGDSKKIIYLPGNAVSVGSPVLVQSLTGDSVAATVTSVNPDPRSDQINTSGLMAVEIAGWDEHFSLGDGQPVFVYVPGDEKTRDNILALLQEQEPRHRQVRPASAGGIPPYPATIKLELADVTLPLLEAGPVTDPFALPKATGKIVDLRTLGNLAGRNAEAYGSDWIPEWHRPALAARAMKELVQAELAYRTMRNNEEALRILLEMEKKIKAQADIANSTVLFEELEDFEAALSKVRDELTVARTQYSVATGQLSLSLGRNITNLVPGLPWDGEFVNPSISDEQLLANARHHAFELGQKWRDRTQYHPGEQRTLSEEAELDARIGHLEQQLLRQVLGAATNLRMAAQRIAIQHAAAKRTLQRWQVVQGTGMFGPEKRYKDLILLLQARSEEDKRKAEYFMAETELGGVQAKGLTTSFVRNRPGKEAFAQKVVAMAIDYHPVFVVPDPQALLRRPVLPFAPQSDDILSPGRVTFKIPGEVTAKLRSFESMRRFLLEKQRTGGKAIFHKISFNGLSSAVVEDDTVREFLTDANPQVRQEGLLLLRQSSGNKNSYSIVSSEMLTTPYADVIYGLYEFLVEKNKVFDPEFFFGLVYDAAKGGRQMTARLGMQALSRILLTDPDRFSKSRISNLTPDGIQKVYAVLLFFLEQEPDDSLARMVLLRSDFWSVDELAALAAGLPPDKKDLKSLLQTEVNVRKGKAFIKEAFHSAVSGSADFLSASVFPQDYYNVFTKGGARGALAMATLNVFNHFRNWENIAALVDPVIANEAEADKDNPSSVNPLAVEYLDPGNMATDLSWFSQFSSDDKQHYINATTDVPALVQISRAFPEYRKQALLRAKDTVLGRVLILREYVQAKNDSDFRSAVEQSPWTDILNADINVMMDPFAEGQDILHSPAASAAIRKATYVMAVVTGDYRFWELRAKTFSLPELRSFRSGVLGYELQRQSLRRALRNEDQRSEFLTRMHAGPVLTAEETNFHSEMRRALQDISPRISRELLDKGLSDPRTRNVATALKRLQDRIVSDVANRSDRMPWIYYRTFLGVGSLLASFLGILSFFGFFMGIQTILMTKEAKVDYRMKKAREEYDAQTESTNVPNLSLTVFNKIYHQVQGEADPQARQSNEDRLLALSKARLTQWLAADTLAPSVVEDGLNEITTHVKTLLRSIPFTPDIIWNKSGSDAIPLRRYQHLLHNVDLLIADTERVLNHLLLTKKVSFNKSARVVNMLGHLSILSRKYLPRYAGLLQKKSNLDNRMYRFPENHWLEWKYFPLYSIFARAPIGYNFIFTNAKKNFKEDLLALMQDVSGVLPGLYENPQWIADESFNRIEETIRLARTSGVSVMKKSSRLTGQKRRVMSRVAPFVLLLFGVISQAILGMGVISIVGYAGSLLGFMWHWIQVYRDIDTGWIKHLRDLESEMTGSILHQLGASTDPLDSDVPGDDMKLTVEDANTVMREELNRAKPRVKAIVIVSEDPTKKEEVYQQVNMARGSVFRKDIPILVITPERKGSGTIHYQCWQALEDHLKSHGDDYPVLKDIPDGKVALILHANLKTNDKRRLYWSAATVYRIASAMESGYENGILVLSKDVHTGYIPRHLNDRTTFFISREPLELLSRFGLLKRNEADGTLQQIWEKVDIEKMTASRQQFAKGFLSYLQSEYNFSNKKVRQFPTPAGAYVFSSVDLEIEKEVRLKLAERPAFAATLNYLHLTLDVLNGFLMPEPDYLPKRLELPDVNANYIRGTAVNYKKLLAWSGGDPRKLLEFRDVLETLSGNNAELMRDFHIAETTDDTKPLQEFIDHKAANFEVVKVAFSFYYKIFSDARKKVLGDIQESSDARIPSFVVESYEGRRVVHHIDSKSSDTTTMNALEEAGFGPVLADASQNQGDGKNEIPGTSGLNASNDTGGLDFSQTTRNIHFEQDPSMMPVGMSDLEASSDRFYHSVKGFDFKIVSFRQVEDPIRFLMK